MMDVETMAAALPATVGRALSGMTSAVRERPAMFSVAAGATLVLSVALPPLLLSVARKPVDRKSVV